MQDEDLLAVLRQATAAQHSRIEKLLRLDEAFTLPHYTTVVQGFELFARHWEPRIEAALPAAMQAWFLPRRRGAMARQDLQALGATPLDEPVALPAIDGMASALGSLYVIEGSALGGQVIARQVQSQYGLTEEQGAAYFNGWGSRTGAMWREFRDTLHTHAGDPAGWHAASTAARQTFESLIRLFERTVHAAA